MSSDYNIYELLDLLSKDNLQVTINSSEAAEKLSLSLSWMLKEIEEDSSLVSSFLSKGILCLIKFFQLFFSQLSTCECNPTIFSSFEDILEILNSIADTGIQTKCTVILQFAEDLVSYITNQLLPFHFRLKVIKYTNLLFERCPTYVKDCLYAKPSYKKHLKNTLKLISTIGDYEFQVGIIECVFRAISKQKRIEAINTLCPPEIRSSILAVKDENFEADCRRILNAFNSQQGARQRVFSIPCLEVILGNLQLHKPKDDNYKEFWIDFNTSSKRISFYCCQIIDNEDPQETDEDIWETICILKDYVQEISSNDDDEVFTVQFKFVPLSIELIPGFTLEKFSFIKMLFKDTDAVIKAIQEIFCSQKCSVAKNQISIKENEKPFSFLPKISLPPLDADQECLEISTAPSLASGKLSIPGSARKSSVPSEIMSSQHSTDGRYREFGAIRICPKLQTSEVLNCASKLKRSGSSRMSRSKVNNETAKQKQERISSQPHNQFKSTKNKNSDSQNFASPHVPVLQSLEELKRSETSSTGKRQVLQMRKQVHSESSLNAGEQSVFIHNSVDEEVDEAIPPTLEPKSPSKDSIQSKKQTSTSIHASKTSSYKQKKNQSTTKNSETSHSNITTRTRSNQTKPRKQSPVGKKQTEIVEEDLKEKGEKKLAQNPKMTPPEKKENSFDKTQSEKVTMDAQPNDLKKQPEDLGPLPNHNTSSNNGCSVTDKESAKAQKSFESDSVSARKSKSDFSSKRNSNESSTTSRKGRRLRSFEKLDLLPQNYPLPKDVKASKETSKKKSPFMEKKPSTPKNTAKQLEEDQVTSIKETQPDVKASKETSKKKSPFMKKNPSTPKNTAKQLEEDNVTNIKETQPDSAKADEVTLIPESLPLQNDIGKPKEDQPKHKPTGPAKPSSKKKLAIDSGISSSKNSTACVNDLTSTELKKRSSTPAPKQNQRNLSSTKQTMFQSSFDKNPLPETNSVNDGKINNEEGKAPKTLDPKQHKDNNQNKSISKEKEESCYQFPSHESPLETISQVPCYTPITEDNLSKFNKEGQKTLAKELDERIEEFVIASCQNLSETSNTSPFVMSPTDTIQSVSFKKGSKQISHDSASNQTNGNKNDQYFEENDPLPSKSLPEAHPKTPSIVITDMEKEQLKDESHSEFSKKVKVPSKQKANENKVVYQAIKLGSVSDLLKNPALSTTKSKQVEVIHKEQPGNLAFPSIEKDQVSISSQKYQPLTNRSKSLDSAKPSFGGKENKIPSKICSSPTEKLFKASPSKRRSLNLPLKRNRVAARVYEKKKGYDPYDFDSGSSLEGSVQPASTFPRSSMTSLLTPKKKKQNSIPSPNSVHSALQLQRPKGKETLPAKHRKATPEDGYTVEKERKAAPGDSSKFEKEKKSTPKNSSKFEKVRKATPEDSYKFEKEKKGTPEDSYKFEKGKKGTPEDSSKFEKERKATPEDSYKFEKGKKGTPEDSSKFEKVRKATPEDSYKFEKVRKATPEDSYKFEKGKKGTPEDSYKFEKERKATPEDSYKFEKGKKGTPEDSYKFGSESEESSTQNVISSPKCIPDSDSDSPQPKKRSKMRMIKSKVTAKTSLPPLDLPKINPARASVRKRKDINYREMSSVETSISSLAGSVYGHKQKKNKESPVKQNQNFLHNNIVTFSSDQDDQMEEVNHKMSKRKNAPVKQNQNFLHINTVTFSSDQDQMEEVNHKMSDAAESLYNTSNTPKSEVSWINPKISKSQKIQVEKTYAIKKHPAYYGSYACIPKRKRNDSPKGKTRPKTKKPKQLSPKGTNCNASPKQNGITNHVFSPKSFGTDSPQHPISIHSSSHDKASHKFSLSPDWKINKKSKRRKACIKEAIFSDSIEIQRADSFVMFPEDSRCSIRFSKTDSILEKSISNPVSSLCSKSISDLEITLSSTEDPKLHQTTRGANNSILSLNDESIISHTSKLLLTPSPYLTIDDLKSNSDKSDEETNELGQAEANTSFKITSLEDISHSTPVKEHNIELSPLVCAGGDYKSKTSFRKSLFSDPKSDNSDESKKSSLPFPIGSNTFLFHGRSSKKVEYNTKVNFLPTPLSNSDKSANMDSSDENSSSSSHEESSRNDTRSDNFLLHSANSSHHQTALSMTHVDDNNIKDIVESFTEDMKMSILSKRKGVAAVIEEVLKGTQKALNKICEQDVLKRSDVHHEFDKKIQQVMNELETSTTLYEDQKNKLLHDFQQQTKDLQKLQDVQQKGLDKLKMINSIYHQTLISEGNSSKAQHQVQNVMKSQMNRLQSKLLDQARQQEMQQVKNQLRKLLL